MKGRLDDMVLSIINELRDVKRENAFLLEKVKFLEEERVLLFSLIKEEKRT
jgi:hypothetical protein